jgi:hypothetical protein
MMKSLVALIRQELEVDPDLIGLSGHSMGGMGITRSYGQLADEFAFFMPLAAGMDLTYGPKEVSEPQVNKVFNVPYIHIQGVRDDFRIFVDRCMEQERRTRELERRYGLRSKLRMVFTDSGHNYDFQTFKTYLSHAFSKRRNLYQKHLFGSIHTGSSFRVTENKIRYALRPVSRYFWIQADSPKRSLRESIHFQARIQDNRIEIDLDHRPGNTRDLRVFLHSKMVDLQKPVLVYIDGVRVGLRDPKRARASLHSLSRDDPGFLFEDEMVVRIPERGV